VHRSNYGSAIAGASVAVLPAWEYVRIVRASVETRWWREITCMNTGVSKSWMRNHGKIERELAFLLHHLWVRISVSHPVYLLRCKYACDDSQLQSCENAGLCLIFSPR
jgi:hypothetical protein